MSYMVKYPDGDQVYVNYRGHSGFTDPLAKAKRLANRVGGRVYEENPQTVYRGTYQRWIPLRE